LSNLSPNFRVLLRGLLTVAASLLLRPSLGSAADNNYDPAPYLKDAKERDATGPAPMGVTATSETLRQVDIKIDTKIWREYRAALGSIFLPFPIGTGPGDLKAARCLDAAPKNAAEVTQEAELGDELLGFADVIISTIEKACTKHTAPAPSPR